MKTLKIKSQNSNFKTRRVTKFFFDKLYILPILVILIILFIDSYTSQITNSKILDHLNSLPKQYTTSEAISNNDMVINKGVITNIDKLNEFYNKISEKKEAYFILTTYNSQELPVIKSVLYKNRNFYVNIDESRTDSNKNKINSYKFDKINKIDNESSLKLKFSNSKSELIFLNYSKYNGKVD